MAAKTVADVMKMVKENEVKFVDFRFTDTRGKEQHVTVPVSHFDEDKFSSGHAFDGSSIAGWKGIEASDMLLMPDAGSAILDPFCEVPTLSLLCEIADPITKEPYSRDPRRIARRAIIGPMDPWTCIGCASSAGRGTSGFPWNRSAISCGFGVIADAATRR